MLMRRTDAVQLHAAAFFFIIMITFFVIADIAASSIHESQITAQAECSRSCVVENCNTIGIRYGKYCGVGWTGCAGEKPCDDLDACCLIHDHCVALNGLTNIKCHEECKRCIKEVEKSGQVGFSSSCTYETAVSTLVQCMDMSILFSQFDTSKTEL
ncbi:probable phospholipase A2 homolog 1 [Sesamum indicum]|uniref:phospholipase A2 n=1 Tax=Sesamum indicum TaxID=4182 RepID=A0A8M8V064_SESIN|nr:probable phospholipase A2 homolog 1 [Sesamum indicum]